MNSTPKKPPYDFCYLEYRTLEALEAKDLSFSAFKLAIEIHGLVKAFNGVKLWEEFSGKLDLIYVPRSRESQNRNTRWKALQELDAKGVIQLHKPKVHDSGRGSGNRVWIAWMLDRPDLEIDTEAPPFKTSRQPKKSAALYQKASPFLTEVDSQSVTFFDTKSKETAVESVTFFDGAQQQSVTKNDSTTPKSVTNFDDISTKRNTTTTTNARAKVSANHTMAAEGVGGGGDPLAPLSAAAILAKLTKAVTDAGGVEEHEARGDEYQKRISRTIAAKELPKAPSRRMETVEDIALAMKTQEATIRGLVGGGIDLEFVGRSAAEILRDRNVINPVGVLHKRCDLERLARGHGASTAHANSEGPYRRGAHGH